MGSEGPEDFENYFPPLLSVSPSVAMGSEGPEYFEEDITGERFRPVAYAATGRKGPEDFEVRLMMKYKYAIHATHTQRKEGTIVVEAHNKDEAKAIANESESWDWDDYDRADLVIDSVKRIGPAEQDKDEDE